MRKYLNWLLGKPLSIEVQCLVDAIDDDAVEWNGERFVGIDAVIYNGVRIYAYTVNSCSGYTVDIGFRTDCLPRHEAKAVYRALQNHYRRRRMSVNAAAVERDREEVRKALGFHNK